MVLHQIYEAVRFLFRSDLRCFCTFDLVFSQALRFNHPGLTRRELVNVFLLVTVNVLKEKGGIIFYVLVNF